MRIYDVNVTGPSVGESGRTQEAQKASVSRTGSSGSSGAGDRVELSSTLGRLSQALSGYESSRSNRVQALTSQYQSGYYQPDSLATSKSMVSDALAAGVD